MKEALDKGAALFNWEEKKKKSGQPQCSTMTPEGGPASTRPMLATAVRSANCVAL